MGTIRDRTLISGIALAGGQSKRLGRNKAIEKIGDQPLIERVVEKLSQITSETIVVVSEEAKSGVLNLPPWVRTAADLYPGSGSLGGIFSGLSAAKGKYGMVVACDMPFLNTDLLRFMMDIISDYDAVVPMVNGRPEPLHSIYSVKCVAYIERRLREGSLKIAGLFNDISVAYVEEDDIEIFDPNHLSFFNINTEEDLNRALALESQGDTATD